MSSPSWARNSIENTNLLLARSVVIGFFLVVGTLGVACRRHSATEASSVIWSMLWAELFFSTVGWLGCKRLPHYPHNQSCFKRTRAWDRNGKRILARKTVSWNIQRLHRFKAVTSWFFTDRIFFPYKTKDVATRSNKTNILFGVVKIISLKLF
jgi:hypothetical protein